MTTVTQWREEDLAYDGSSAPQSRKLTPRERDILCRALHSLVYPYYEQNIDNPWYAEARAAIEKYTRVFADSTDTQTLYDVMQVLTPRRDEEGNPR